MILWKKVHAIKKWSKLPAKGPQFTTGKVKLKISVVSATVSDHLRSLELSGINFTSFTSL